MKKDLFSGTPENTLNPQDSLVYLKLEHTPLWAQQHTHTTQELFTRSVCVHDKQARGRSGLQNRQYAFVCCLSQGGWCILGFHTDSGTLKVHVFITLCHRDLLLRVLSMSQLLVSYKAKDLLRTVLQHCKDDLSWKQGMSNFILFANDFNCFILSVASFWKGESCLEYEICYLNEFARLLRG